jgi:hypothetical protein
MKKKFETGELILIEHEKKSVACALVNYKGKNGNPRVESFGVLEGDFSYVKKGALTAAYYHTIEYLKNKNIKKINFGSSRPFFFDGVLRNKLVWGGKIVCRSSQAFLLCPLSERKCLKNFLSNNPFIYKNNNDLILATFNHNTDKECSTLSISKTKAKNCGIDKIINLSI